MDIRKTFFVFSALFLSNCATESLTPDGNSVKVSRNKPDSHCEELGRVTGTTTSVKGKPDDALADMKNDASRRGANYVVLGQYSDAGTSVTGMAYRCP